MMLRNESTLTKFFFVGFTNDPKLEVPFFVLFLSVYTFTLLGNCCILAIVWLSPQLHTPMYFFLTQLACLDLFFSSTISPKMLADLLTEKRIITFSGCMAQIYFFSAFASTEFFMLAVMAYDRYVAICNPLTYTIIMNNSMILRLVAGSYIGGFLNSLIHASGLYRLSFCGPDVMNHFVCDYPVLLKLSCTDILINELVLSVLASFIVVGSLLVIFVSYSYIIRAILKMGNTAGRSRAASTCISHFTCVFLFHGSVFLNEILPKANTLEGQYKVVTVILTVMIPALNPLIYSLRNNEVKEAVRKILSWTFKTM
ncbi:olfactory receptor 5J3-like [Pleurodeles waltl]|uniref:olfactory receptor 5J3-like n=1 Tax=Pleurodeles waltl TaxID=8319 RepID=UPI0037097AEA